MLLIRRILLLLPVLLFFGKADGQLNLPFHFLRLWHLPSRPRPFDPPAEPIPVSRWLLTFNPFGLLEPPAAFGIGAGYRLNTNTEIWSETSLIRSGIMPTYGSVNGIRQIVQVKRFTDRNPNVFFAFELRYKSFSYRDTNDFANPATHDTLTNVQFLSSHYFFAGGFQIGKRWLLSKDGRLTLEGTIGIGVKFKTINRLGPPAGYKYEDKGFSTDYNIRDAIETPGTEPYFPGSLRILYNFGKRLK